MTFALADLVRVSLLEELGSNFRQPLGVDSTHFAHVLFRRLNELMVNDPLWALVEERGTRMNVDLLIVGDRLIAFRWVLAATVIEEAGNN